jgi:nucleoside-diphosphate-sugar epimerase
MKRILVTGSSGFIGGHLVKRLKDQGHFVVGVDLEMPKYNIPDEFIQCDLRNEYSAFKVFGAHNFDEVYSLACLMGGMGYIGNPEHSYDVMVGSSQVVINTLENAIKFGVKKIFYSSSACVYNQKLQEKTDGVSLAEHHAYPAFPDLVYGWQKLFSEQLHQAAKDRIDIRIARFHNIYGPEGTWYGGKEKAPAAVCRKVLESDSVVEIWGSGQQTRSFLYIDDCIDAVQALMASDHREPINIGSEELISINALAEIAIHISGKDLKIKNIDGPVGVMGRNSNNDLIMDVLGWAPRYTLYEGLSRTFKWIKQEYERNL